MTMTCRNNHILLWDRKTKDRKAPIIDACHQQPVTRGVQNVALKGKTREMFNKVEISVSSYDTAWVAMVPSREDPHMPCFPACLDWVMENQRLDGSWGLHPRHPLLVKDSLSSTLACLLALQKWKVGKQLVRRGLDYIGSNNWAADDERQYSPIGFDVIFPGMLNYAQDLGLNLPLSPVSVNLMLRKRDLEVERAFGSGLEEKRGNLAYVAEGLNKSYDWKKVLRYQRSNGSIFNSPSTTAATLIHLHDDKCFEYLSSLLKVYQGAVPTIYPLDIYMRLSMVDTVEKLGIDRYFKYEVESVLDEAYRCWLWRDERIVSDPACCALAFRLLRMKGYEISSERLADLDEQEHFFNSVNTQFANTKTVLELYRASQVTTPQKEPILEKIHAWTSSFLKQQLLNQPIHEDKLYKEVEYALKHPHSSLERIENRRSIEQYNVDDFQLLKTSYRCSNIDNKDLLELSLEDFNACQAIHQEELRHLQRWVQDSRLDQLKFARQWLSSNYFSVASILSAPELSDARISWTKNSFLSTVVDDFFDVCGSTEELLNIIELVEMWESTIDHSSEQVEIIFSALRDIIDELASKASIHQGRCVKHHLIEIWLNMLKCMMKEVAWGSGKIVPTMDEYMSNGCVTISLGPIVLITAYFLGSELSDEVIRSAEFSNLYKHMSTIGRLLNDLQTVKRETEEGKLNSVSLYVIQSPGGVSEEEAITEMRRIIESNRKELLRMVLQTKGSLVPKACKELFWKTSKIFYYYYMSCDGYTSQSKIIKDMNAVVHDQLIPLNTSVL